jgi:D-alanyl-D-alanine carboxypeptidase
VAPPGHSEHHTGLAIDVGDGARPACDVEPCFEETAAAAWLAEHARTFGFELSFPRGSRQPHYEPWHWRYRGDEASRRVFE